MTPPQAVLRRFGLRDPVHVAETAIAHVWKVRRGGGFAALKIYKNDDPKGEEVGFRLMQALNGVGMVKIHHAAQSILVMEWLDGPSLGDLSRAGQDDQAAAILIEVANRIHSADAPADLKPLGDQFRALLNLDAPVIFSDPLRHHMGRARTLARTLLDQQEEVTALHGDLHHDNIKGSDRGYLAFDAKGLVGDRAYDLANAFRNPLGAPDLVNDPARARRLAEKWAADWGTTPRRLLSWAVAHTALSISWAGNCDDTAEADLLAMLFDLLDAS